MQTWYHKSHEIVFGPFTAAQLRQQAIVKRIGRQTLVRMGSEGKWVRAAIVKGLFDESPSAADKKTVADDEVVIVGQIRCLHCQAFHTPTARFCKNCGASTSTVSTGGGAGHSDWRDSTTIMLAVLTLIGVLIMFTPFFTSLSLGISQIMAGFLLTLGATVALVAIAPSKKRSRAFVPDGGKGVKPKALTQQPYVPESGVVPVVRNAAISVGAAALAAIMGLFAAAILVVGAIVLFFVVVCGPFLQAHGG